MSAGRVSCRVVHTPDGNSHRRQATLADAAPPRYTVLGVLHSAHVRVLEWCPPGFRGVVL